MKAVRCNICIRDFKTDKPNAKIRCPHCNSNESFSVRELPICWDGSVLKKLIKDNKFKITTLSSYLCVTRQSIANWINGMCPKGMHLVGLCRYFDVSPEVFFTEQT